MFEMISKDNERQTKNLVYNKNVEIFSNWI